MIKIEVSEAVALLLQEHGSRRIEPDERGRLVIEVDDEVFDSITRLARATDVTINDALVDVLTGKVQPWQQEPPETVEVTIRRKADREVVATTSATHPEELDTWLAAHGYDPDEFEIDAKFPPEWEGDEGPEPPDEEGNDEGR